MTGLEETIRPAVRAPKVSRRQLLGGAAAGAALLAGGVADVVASPSAFAASTGSTGPYSLKTPYFYLAGENGAITTLAFAPDGSGSYGDNLLVDPGLYFQFLSDGAQIVATSSHTTAEVTASSLTLTVPVYNHSPLSQLEQNNGYDIALGNGAGQTFVAPNAPVDELGIGLFTAFGSRPTSNLTLQILAGGPGGNQVFSTEITPGELAQLNGGPNLTFVSLSGVSLTPGDTYFISLSTGDDAWAVLYQDPATLAGGELYLGGTVKPDAEMMFALESSTGVLEYQAVWTISVDGPALTSTVALTASAAHVLDHVGVEFLTAWEYSGYDTTNPATTPFTRFFDSEGEYLPIEEFKRRPSMFGQFSFDVGANSSIPSAVERKWIYFTGQRGYNLEFAWPDICLHFAMESSSMTFKFYQSGYAATSNGNKVPIAAGQTLSYPFNVTVSPQSDWVPEWYPVISSSDPLVDRWMTSFYWGRGFAWLPGAYGPDWLDWMGLALDWQGGPQREGQKRQLEYVPLTEDGYVWTLNPGEGWAFPSPPYDNRHFTTNAMYILGISHYYSWTGDPVFLEKMLPRAEKAMEYYLTKMGGESGLVTCDRGEVGTTGRPTHTGEDGAPGTNYWDLISYGWKDAYVNLYFYGSIGALAELEFKAGNTAMGRKLTALKNKVRRAYNKTFWTEVVLPDGRRAGRYIQTIDERGVHHDHGATYLNLEAMRFGLPWKSYGKKILDWLDNGQTELTTNLVVLNGGGPSVTIGSGETAAQSFLATGEFTHVAPQISTNGQENDTSEMTLSLYAGSYPNGKLVASRHYVGVYNGGFNNVLEVPVQPAGYYYLEVSDTSGPIVWSGASSSYSDGTAYVNGQASSSPQAFSFALVSPHQAGPADIYSTYNWAPRVTTRKNNFWYIWLWSGVTVPWGTQLEDGGADLYECGFDMIARSKYSSAEDAYGRLKALLERYSLPDRLCGGSPLYLGEIPENEVSAGAVGVDVPFPESALAPGSFVHAFLGLEATPSRLYIRPHLPSQMEWVRVEKINHRGRVLTVTVDHHHVTVEGLGAGMLRRAYRPGQRVLLEESA
jgi:hypothetical protein